MNAEQHQFYRPTLPELLRERRIRNRKTWTWLEKLSFATIVFAGTYFAGESIWAFLIKRLLP